GVQAGLLADPGRSRVPQPVRGPWLDSGQPARRADRRAVAGDRHVAATLGTENELIRIIRQPGREQEPGAWPDRDDAVLALVHRLVQARPVNPDGPGAVDLARPHGDQLPGPARQQELNLDHGPIPGG